MPAPRFIRIGAPSGDGPPVAAPAPAPEPEPPAPPAAGSTLPPEVFGVWAEEIPPAPVPARPEGSTNGHGHAAAGHRPAPAVQVPAVVAAAPSPAMQSRGSAPPPARAGRTSHEDDRLNAMRKSGRPVEAVCFDDLRVVGRLAAFDQYALILEVDGQETVVFKHGVIMVRYAE